MIRLPVHIHEKIHRIQREMQDFELETGREPELGDIAIRIDMPAHKVAELQRLPSEPLSIHALSIDELIAVEARSDFVLPDPMDIVFESELHGLVDKMLASLNTKEEQILRLRYGVGVQSSLTLDEIGKRYGVTRERIRQLEGKALRTLKSPSRLAAFAHSLHGHASPRKKLSNANGAKSARADHALKITSHQESAKPEAWLEPAPSTQSSSVDTIFLQAKALGAAIELDRKKRLEKIGVQ